MENCKYKCSLYLFAYFISALVGIAFGLLLGFGLIPISIIAIQGLIAIAALIFLTVLLSKLTTCITPKCYNYSPLCIIRHLAIESALAVVFGIIALVLFGSLIAVSVFIGLAVAAFTATLISSVAAIFSYDGYRGYKEID